MLFKPIISCCGWISPPPHYNEGFGPTRHTDAMSEMPKDNIPDTGTRANQAATSERTVLIRRIALDSTDPFSTEREIMISHGSETHRLRLTSQTN